MFNFNIFWKKYWYVLFIFLVMAIAVFLRFYDYPNHWGLAYDQAHDAIVAHYAVDHFKIPLLGPFSSAGPYQTGGEWYWLIMLGIVLFPTYVNGPWIFMTIFQTFFVLAVILVGKELVNKKFGIIAGLLAAVSPTQVSQSVNLSCTAPIAFFSLGSIWAMIRLVRTRKPFYGFLLGLFVGTAISIHTQGAALLLLIVLTVLIMRLPIKYYVFIALGILLPFLPIFIAEAPHGFFNTKGALQYYLHDQYKIPLDQLGRRWLTYLGILWPNAMAVISGGFNILGYFMLVATFITSVILFIKGKLSKEWIIVSLTFFGFIVGLRYVHAPLFDSYFMFVNPFVFFLLGLFFYTLFQKGKLLQTISAILLFLFIIGSLYRTSQEIVKGMNSATLVMNWEKALVTQYPRQGIDLYDYKFRDSSFSFPLLYYLQFTHMQSDTGHRIAFGRPTAKEDMAKNSWFSVVPYGTAGFDILDVQSSSSAELSDAGWAKITPQLVYISTELWYLNKK